MTSPIFALTRRDFVGVCAASFLAPSLGALGKRRSASGKTNVAVLGAGGHGRRAAQMVANTTGLSLAAIVDPNLDAAAGVASSVRGRARTGHCARAIAWDHSIFEDESVDAVIVATGRTSYGLLAAEALTAGKQVLVARQPLGGDKLDVIATAAGRSSAHLRFASRCADAEVAALLRRSPARVLGSLDRHVIVDVELLGGRTPPLRLPAGSFMELPAAIAFLGSATPTSLYAVRGSAIAPSGQLEPTFQFAYSFPRNATLEIRGRVFTTDGDAALVPIRTRLRFVERSATELELALLHGPGNEDAHRCLEDSVYALETWITNDNDARSRSMAGSLRDDLIAAYVFENATL